MPGFTITRGLGGSASSLIAQGFFNDVRKIVRGGSRFAKKLVSDFRQDISISVMLLSTNGKELIKPIFNSMAKAFNSDIVEIKVLPKKLIKRKSKRIKVSIDNVNVRNKNNERN